MKTTSTFKNWLTLHLFFLSALILLISTPVFSQVKHVISVTKNKFTPNEIKISVGDTIEWKNTDGFHNVNGIQATYPMNPESFGNSTGTGWTYSHVFTISGKYDYQCDPHVGLGMIGKIEVADKSPMKHIVGVTKNVFTPANLVIHRGDTVEWRNTDGFHNVNGTQANYPMNPESFGNSTGTGWTYSHVFTMSGKYDYQCDPHVGLGMIGMIEVIGKDDDVKKTLTVNFSNMNPHVGQTLWLAVIDKVSGKEIERKSEIVSVAFSMQISGLEMNHSYNVDFYADHNGNGQYDAPPADHAWRMELNDVMGDTTLNFQHNTSFTDINWISTAISELNNSSFKMYPNPATVRVFIESNEFNSSVVKVMIYDISGKLKLSKIHSPKQILEIDVHELVNGMYFVELSNEYKREMLKLIKY